MKKSAISITAFVFLFTAPCVSFAGDAPKSVPGATTVHAAGAKNLFDKGVPFVDVRGDEDYKDGHIKGAIHLELKGVLSYESLSAKIKKDQEVVFYCNGPKCGLSSHACEKAVGWGFTKVYYYYDGFPDWKSKGYPVE